MLIIINKIVLITQYNLIYGVSPPHSNNFEKKMLPNSPTLETLRPSGARVTKVLNQLWWATTFLRTRQSLMKVDGLGRMRVKVDKGRKM